MGQFNENTEVKNKPECFSDIEKSSSRNSIHTSEYQTGMAFIRENQDGANNPGLIHDYYCASKNTYDSLAGGSSHDDYKNNRVRIITIIIAIVFVLLLFGLTIMLIRKKHDNSSHKKEEAYYTEINLELLDNEDTY